MTPDEDKLLNRLMLWLFVYIACSIGLAWAAGKLPDALSMVTNVASGFFGAAMMLARGPRKEG